MTRQLRLREAADRAVACQTHALSLKETGRLRWVADDSDCPDMMRLAALAEELGEVARALHDGASKGRVAGELDQLAGVAIAWSSLLIQYPDV